MVNTIRKLGRCRLCKSNDYEKQFEKYDYGICKCRTCGLVFLDFEPSPEFFKNYYSEDFFNDAGAKHGFNDYESEVGSLTETFSKRIEVIKKYKNQGTILDIGCATGVFLALAENSFQAFGLEISDYAGDAARKKGLEVFTGNLEDSPYLQRKFDVVTLWDTIEHLDDPDQTLKNLASITDTGGILALTTGDVSSVFSKLSGKLWHLYNVPQHLSFFDKNSITQILERNQFSVKQITYPALHFSLDYILFRLITFYKINRLINSYRFLKHKHWLTFDLPINLFDIMFVIAEKNNTG